MLHNIKKILIQLFVLLLITFFLLILLEIFSRIVFGKPHKYVNVAVLNNIISDPLLNHKWKPNSVFVEKRSTPYTIYVNGQSWLERKDVAVEKPENTIKVLVCGLRTN